MQLWNLSNELEIKEFYQLKPTEQLFVSVTLNFFSTQKSIQVLSNGSVVHFPCEILGTDVFNCKQ